MEEKFRITVQHIFSNWTGLQLAIQHGMGGPNSVQAGIDFMNYIVEYCTQNVNPDAHDIQEVLEDILDEEFETICEDDSPAEIANILHRFLTLLKEGDMVKYDLEQQNLPTCQAQLTRSRAAVEPKQTLPAEAIDVVPTTSVPMEEDNEWTEVKTRRKR